MYIYFEDEGGYKESKQFFARVPSPLTVDYDGKKAGIKRISWSNGSLTRGSPASTAKYG